MALRDKLQGKSAGIKAQADAEMAKPASQVPHAPRTAIGQASAFQMAIADKERELQAVIASKSSIQVSLLDLHEVPGRKRSLTNEQRSELKANLANNPLTSPITVRNREQGGYEIVAGHNRVEVFRDLGRDKILAVILELNDDEADRSAFYSNLLAPSLPDFEKFLGFSARARKKHFTQEQLADEAGISRQMVGFLLSYEHLPAEALQALVEAQDKTILGATAAQKLASLAKSGKQSRVVEAIRKLVSKELSQSAAVSYAVESGKSKPAKLAPIVIRHGKKTFCSISRSPKDLRLSFSAPEDLNDALIERVKSVIQAYAKEER